LTRELLGLKNELVRKERIIAFMEERAEYEQQTGIRPKREQLIVSLRKLCN
jgi:hypothetical protein